MIDKNYVLYTILVLIIVCMGIIIYSQDNIIDTFERAYTNKTIILMEDNIVNCSEPYYYGWSSTYVNVTNETQNEFIIKSITHCPQICGYKGDMFLCQTY